jgi:hypothetical protein
MWLRALNDKPRAQAVKTAPFEFAFHRRSIRGVVKIPTENDIIQEQKKAESARKLRKRKSKAIS